MKNFKLIAAISILTFFCSRLLGQNVESAEVVVQRHLEAFNKGDIDQFMETLSPDVEFYTLRGKLIWKGHDQVKKEYNDFFKDDKRFHLKLVKRIVLDKIVIEETISTTNKRGAVILEVDKGKIISVTFTD
jgi:uncharacterized protein (TIGR02246 family)